MTLSADLTISKGEHHRTFYNEGVLHVESIILFIVFYYHGTGLNIFKHLIIRQQNIKELVYFFKTEEVKEEDVEVAEYDTVVMGGTEPFDTEQNIVTEGEFETGLFI